MLDDLIGKMTAPEEVKKAMIGSVWYSKDGGVIGSRSIIHIEKNQVRGLVIDMETYNCCEPFDAVTGRDLAAQQTLYRTTTMASARCSNDLANDP